MVIKDELHCRYSEDRITKDVVCFHPADFAQVADTLQLDLHEPPMSQVILSAFTSSRNTFLL